MTNREGDAAMTSMRPKRLNPGTYAMFAFVACCLAVLMVTGCNSDAASRPTKRADAAGAKQPAESKPKAITNSIGMKLSLIPAGEFLMGSTDSDSGGRDDEKPQHRVRISNSFYMGFYEVTQGEYEAVMEANPSSFSKNGLLKNSPGDHDVPRFPVDGVTWYEAVEFCRKLSEFSEEKDARRSYRLPTEAEWEYACRAGTKTVFHYGDTLSAAQANFNGKYPFGDAKEGPFLNRTAAVGSYKPNAFGLYDMHGNVNEWCADKFSREYYRVSPEEDPRGPSEGTSPVIRGGDWYSDGRDCRSAFRYADIPEGTFYALGFRVVCELGTGGAVPAATFATATNPKQEPATNTVGPSADARPSPMTGEDWPRWRGPRGDGTWRAPKLPETWPTEGLRRVWRRGIGGGYGGVAVSGGRVYVMDRQTEPEDVERVLCFDGVNGKPLWSRQYPVDYSGVSYGYGPRATPTVFEGQVFTLGAVGHLLCLDATEGYILWSRDLVGELEAKVPMWGLSASPLVFEDLLIVHAGVPTDGCYIAFDRKTGDERWRSVPDPAGYATPLLIERDGIQQLVCWTPNHVRGLDPRTGDVLWTIPFEVNNGTSIAGPIFQEGLVLVSSYYDGSKAIRLGDKPRDASVAWEDRRNLRALMAQPLYRDGHAYLIDKRHGLTCFELSSGQKLWDDDNRMTPKGRNPQATMVWLGDEDRAIVLNSDGELILARFNPQGYVEQSRANIIGRTWAHPAYAGNCVYARSNTELVCVLLPSRR